MKKEITIDTEYIVKITGKVIDDDLLPTDKIIENMMPYKLEEMLREELDKDLNIDVSANKLTLNGKTLIMEDKQ